MTSLDKYEIAFLRDFKMILTKLSISFFTSVKDKIIRNKSFLVYLIVGGWNTLFGMGTYTAFYLFFGKYVHYMLLSILVNILAITNSFLCYKIFVFQTEGNWLKEYIRCYLVYGAGALLGMGQLWLFVHFFAMNPVIANALGTVLVVIASYFGHKYFSFRKSST